MCPFTYYRTVVLFYRTGDEICSDSKHSGTEERFFCIGKVNGRVIIVRFTYRFEKIRIIGAGYWRKGVKYYDKER